MYSFVPTVEEEEEEEEQQEEKQEGLYLATPRQLCCHYYRKIDVTVFCTLFHQVIPDFLNFPLLFWQTQIAYAHSLLFHLCTLEPPRTSEKVEVKGLHTQVTIAVHLISTSLYS